MTAITATRVRARQWMKPWPTKTLTLFLTATLLTPSLPSQQNTGYTLRSETDLVLVNVSVRDKSGDFVRDLKQGEFTVTEDGKAQQVVSFDVENTDAVPPATVEQAKLLDSLKKRPTETQQNSAPPNPIVAFKD